MVYLKVAVKCFRCSAPVNKNDARIVKGIYDHLRYECFSCFKKIKEVNEGVHTLPQEKRQLYCQKCNYKFNSFGIVCPYCSKPDFVTEANVSIHDLL